ncbi:TPA: hypothetical protein ACH3X3_003334 [Trebouxia sp. C0006]
MQLRLPNQVSKGVTARYPINIFLTYTKAGVRQHTLEPFLLGTMMQTVMLNLDHLSPFGVRLLGSQHGKHCVPAAQQQLNSVYSLPSDIQHSPLGSPV